MFKHFRVGDWVVYRKSKHSPHPGPRAANVNPARSGDLYAYTVDKFWVVREVLADGSVVVETRKHKRHVVAAGDPCLRKASLWQRWRFRNRFQAIVGGQAQVERDAQERADRESAGASAERSRDQVSR